MGLSARQTGTNPTSTTPGIITGSLVANTPDTFDHGLGRVPTMVIVTINAAAAAAANHVAWDVASSDDTQVTLVSAGNCDFVATCLP